MNKWYFPSTFGYRGQQRWFGSVFIFSLSVSICLRQDLALYPSFWYSGRNGRNDFWAAQVMVPGARGRLARAWAAMYCCTISPRPLLSAFFGSRCPILPVRAVEAPAYGD